MEGTSRESVLQTSLLNNCMRLPHSYCMIVTLIKLIVHLIIEPHSNQRKDPLPIIGPGEVKSDSVYCSLCLVPIPPGLYMLRRHCIVNDFTLEIHSLDLSFF